MPPRPTAGQHAVTQGQFAVALAARLGLGEALTEPRAIARLESAGIRPDAGWARRGPATDMFVVQVQKSIHVILTRLATVSGIPVPATLGLVLSTPGQMGGQTFEALTPQQQDPRAAAAVTLADLLKTGESRSVSIESPHPYPAGDDQQPVTWSYRLRVPGARNLAVHFSRTELAADDVLRVLDRQGRERLRITGRAPRTDAWSEPLTGDTAIVVIHAGPAGAAWGVRLDKYVFRAH